MIAFRIWLARKLAPLEPLAGDHVNAARLLRAAVEDADQVLQHISAVNQPVAYNIKLAIAQVRTNIGHALGLAGRAGITRARDVDGN